MLFTLVYISRATKEMSHKDLEDILEVSRRNNSYSAVTGMLIYKNGEFIQALEGKKEIVEDLFKIISKDKRHDDIILLARKDIDHRCFGDWSMGFKNISEISPTGLIDPDSFFSEKNQFQQGNTALNFLSSFYKG